MLLCCSYSAQWTVLRKFGCFSQVLFFLRVGQIFDSCFSVKWKFCKPDRHSVFSSPPLAQFQPSVCAQPPCQLWQEPAERCEVQAPPLIRQLWWQGAGRVPGHSGPPLWQPRGRGPRMQANGKRGRVWPSNHPLLLTEGQRRRTSRGWASDSAPSLVSDQAPNQSNPGLWGCPSPVHALLFFSAFGEAQVTQEATASNPPVPHSWPRAWKALQP